MKKEYKYVTSVEDRQEVVNISLIERDYLQVTKKYSKVKVTRKYLNEETHGKFVAKEDLSAEEKTVKYPLHEITREQIKQLRAQRKSLLLFKDYGRYFYVELPNDLSLIKFQLFGKAHCCAHNSEVCKRLSAATDAEGGCAKVRDKHAHIENYPFILQGYESINMHSAVLCVTECQNQINIVDNQSKKITIAEKSAAIVGLAAYLYDDVDTITQVRQKKEKNYKLYGVPQ